MTSRPDDSAPTPTPPEPGQTDGAAYADRVYRSPAAIAGGVLLLALCAWLGVDAILRGEDRTPWLAGAGLLVVVPLVVAFTLRPAVFAGADRLRVRNPFRTITLPWGSVEGLRATYSSEVFAAGGGKYQLWAIPVSLRGRKRAHREAARTAAGAADAGPDRAPADQAMDELRELQERNAPRAAAQGAPSVRWAYEILGPVLAGAVVLVVLIAMG